MAFGSSWVLLSCFILLILVDIAVALPDSLSNPAARFHIQYQTCIASLRQALPNLYRGFFNIGAMVALCTLLPTAWYLRRKRALGKELSHGDTSSQTTLNEIEKDTDMAEAEASDPGLLKKHSEFKSYSTSRYTYPKLRVFFRKHPQAAKLPVDPAPLPLLCFLHGLGGSVSQFHPLLTSLVNNGTCLAIDLPGCGLSAAEPKDWNAYTTESLVELLSVIIDDYREKEAGQGVVLIGHSMGASFAALLACQSSNIADHVMGLVGICPKASPPNEEQVASFRRLLWIPSPIFDLWRRYDRRGGINSPSVRRFIGEGEDTETKLLQYKFNEQSRTPVWRRMASGSLPTYINGLPRGGLPGEETWSTIDVPVFLVGGESDSVTKPDEVDKISTFLRKSHPNQIKVKNESQPIPDSAAPVNIDSKSTNTTTELVELQQNGKLHLDVEQTSEDPSEDPSTPNEGLGAANLIPPQLRHPKKVLKTTILPAPASHALLYQPSTVRILAGLISDFLAKQVSPRLSLGWQLQFLSTSGKWDVKNLSKWQKINPVSEPIAGVFRAMKTLREVDESHCPKVFVQEYGNEIKDIVDISHESPVYDPRGLEAGGIHYSKFPTVSKLPPQGSEVDHFILLIDRLREEHKARAEKEGWTEPCYIGVHCHYGFNRTGYFIVCYLVERLGYDIQSAVDLFKEKRPKGIKHAHFLDQLFVRYCKGLKRAPTL